MAIQKSNPLMQFTSGHIGKLIVFKNYGGKTVISRYPDMSGVKRSKKQKDENSLFKRAVAFARIVKADPSQITDPDFTIKPGQSLYHAALSWYLNKEKESKA